MAKLYLSEFSHLGFDGNSSAVLAPQVPSGVEQNLPVSITAGSSEPFNASTRFIMVNTDAACCLAFNQDAVATAHRMGANETRFYAVKAGDFLSVIQASA